MKNLKQKFILLTIILLCSISGHAQQNINDFLFKIIKGEYDEVGVESGYVNLIGDTVIPIGKYQYCYTDTLKNYAIVLKKGGGCIAIDKNENVLFEVFWYDNGPDYLAEGLFRIKKNGKIGYANKMGKIIIEPQFDCAFPFKNGKAKVSNKCNTIPDGEHLRWESDNWYFIDKNGLKTN